MYKNNQSGIALLVALLVMSLALVVVVQIVSNVAVPDVEISSGEEASSRAFSAAEAGIEQALLQNVGYSTSPGGVDLGNNARFSAELEAAGSSSQFNYPKKLLNGEVATFWFVGHDTNDNYSCAAGSSCYSGNVVFLYDDGTAINQLSAIEVTFYYDTTGNFLSGNFANVNVARYAYDRTNNRGNNFTNINNCPNSCTITDTLGNSRTYLNQTPTITPPSCGAIPNCIIMARVRSLYNSSPIAVGIRATGGQLPNQVKKATSVGLAGGSDSEAVRRIEAYQSYPEPLSIFEGALISPNGDIVKN